MVTGIIGRKVGMTQVFDADGTVHPATVIKAGPCVVVQGKTTQTDGYDAVQLGLVEERPAKVGKPLAGHFKKAGVPPTRVRRHQRERAKDAGAPRLPLDDPDRRVAHRARLRAPAAIVGAQDVEGWGGRVVRVPLVNDKSTTSLLAKLRRGFT